MHPIAWSWHESVHCQHVNIASTRSVILIYWIKLRLFRWQCTGRHFSVTVSSSMVSISLWSVSSWTGQCHGRYRKTFSPIWNAERESKSHNNFSKLNEMQLTAWNVFVYRSRKCTAFWQHNTVCRCSSPTVACPDPNFRFQWTHTIERPVPIPLCSSFLHDDVANRYQTNIYTAADRRNVFHFHTTFGQPKSNNRHEWCQKNGPVFRHSHHQTTTNLCMQNDDNHVIPFSHVAFHRILGKSFIFDLWTKHSRWTILWHNTTSDPGMMRRRTGAGRSETGQSELMWHFVD